MSQTRLAKSSLTLFAKKNIDTTNDDSLRRIFAFFSMILAHNTVPVAATASLYSYFQGQPVSGIDLCPSTTVNCIQGYLTETGQAWKQGMPQIARFIEENVTLADDCISHQHLEEMLLRAYRGIAELANCTLSTVTNLGTHLTVFATNVDTITCNIMRDSITGYADQCKVRPTTTGPSTPTLALGIAIGIPVLSLLLLGLFMLWLYYKKPSNQERYRAIV